MWGTGRKDCHTCGIRCVDSAKYPGRFSLVMLKICYTVLFVVQDDWG
jgi:hypothetical protein